MNIVEVATVMNPEITIEAGPEKGDAEVRRADSELLRDAVHALRYQAYRRVDAIPEDPSERFSDPWDEQPNTVSYLVTEQGKPVASIRANLCIPSELTGPGAARQHQRHIAGYSSASMDLFREDIYQKLGEHCTLVESNRFVTIAENPDASLRYQVQLFRMICANAIAHDLDYVVTAVRRKHVLFYRKALQMKRLSPPRRPPDLDDDFVLVGCRFSEAYPLVCDRDPRMIIDTDDAHLMALV